MILSTLSLFICTLLTAFIFFRLGRQRVFYELLDEYTKLAKEYARLEHTAELLVKVNEKIREIEKDKQDETPERKN